jgi:uncharacterized protein YeaO (DUF488 family)
MADNGPGRKCCGRVPPGTPSAGLPVSGSGMREKEPGCQLKVGKIMIKVKSIYDSASDDDAFRVLVEPVWPLKVSREKTVLNAWLRDLAPSPGLYGQYSQGLVTWDDFVVRYHGELNRHREFFRDLQVHNHDGGLTLVHGSRNADRNPAVVLKMLLEKEDPAGTGGSGLTCGLS